MRLRNLVLQLKKLGLVQVHKIAFTIMQGLQSSSRMVPPFSNFSTVTPVLLLLVLQIDFKLFLEGAILCTRCLGLLSTNTNHK